MYSFKTYILGPEGRKLVVFMLIQLFKFSTYNLILVHFESNVSFVFGKCISA